MSDRVQGRLRWSWPVAIRTLADLAERNHLYAHCNRCRHARQLDVPMLLARFGPLTFGRLKNRLRCARCRARRPEVMHVWNNGPSWLRGTEQTQPSGSER